MSAARHSHTAPLSEAGLVLLRDCVRRHGAARVNAAAGFGTVTTLAGAVCGLPVRGTTRRALEHAVRALDGAEIDATPLELVARGAPRDPAATPRLVLLTDAQAARLQDVLARDAS